MTEKPSVTMPGTVEKIIPPAHPSEPEKAQIAIEGAMSCIEKSASKIHSRMKMVVKCASLDPSLSPTSLAEQLPSSSVPLLTLDAWVSLLPGRSAWPIVPFVRG
jgi:hypothetical protein